MKVATCILQPDWRAKFKTMKFQDISKIKQFHHFTFSSMSKGSVARQTTWLMKLCTSYCLKFLLMT